MRTVSPTFALVGVIISLGPLGAAMEGNKRKLDQFLLHSIKAILVYQHSINRLKSWRLTWRSTWRFSVSFIEIAEEYLFPKRDKDLNWVDTHY